MQRPKQTIDYTLDGRSWTLASQSLAPNAFVSEYVVQGDKISHWKELLTANIQTQDVDVTKFSNTVIGSLKKDCPSFVYNTTQISDQDILLEWSHHGCQNHAPQHEIKRFMKGADGVYMLSYTTKDANFSRVNYDKWKVIISDARLKLLPAHTGKSSQPDSK